MRLLTVLVVLLPALAAAQTPDLVATLTTPILAWSNRASLGLQQEPQVSYEVIARSEAFTSNLMLAGLGKLSDAVGLGSLLSADQLKAQQHSTVVVFIGSQLTSATLRRGGASAAQLNALLGAATSSVVLPYTHAEGETIRAALTRTAKDAGLQLKAVGCGPDAIDTAAEVTSALAGSTDLLEVLLVCAQVPAEQDRTPEGMALELAQLLAAQQAVAASGLNHLFVYTSETIPTAMLKPAVRTAGRSLLQDQPTGEDTSSTFVGFGNYTTCGALCQTQVRWLEGMLAVLFMALAACSGLLCLYMLDTPTRFETPKDAGAAQ